MVERWWWLRGKVVVVEEKARVVNLVYLASNYNQRTYLYISVHVWPVMCVLIYLDSAEPRQL